jgi:cell division topological specificity factor MinE
MNLLSFFTPIRSAPIARKRLQILLEADRGIQQSDLIARVREEIFSRIGRHITFDPDTIRVRKVNGSAICTVVIDMELPGTVPVDALVSPTGARQFPAERRN